MKRFLALMIVCGAFLGGGLVSRVAYAETPLSEGQIKSIRQNCVTAQTTLNRLHASDALLRVNRGQLYENISNKLMAPLNSRIALSRLEGLSLTATTLEYDRQVDIFRASYSTYEESMSRTLKINCADRPTEFYESIVTTREKRKRLHEDTEILTTLLKAYKTEFEAFAAEFNEGDIE